MSASQLALAIRIPANRVTAILRGERAVSGPELWMNLQSRYDVSVVESARGRAIEEEVPIAASRR